MAKVDFTNPYNFIPLGTKRAGAEEEKGALTGTITYSVYTRTPLFIPNTSNSRAFTLLADEKNPVDPEHKIYDFFSYADLSDTSHTYEKEYHAPIIPGSEIRGMLRSNFEILTNSCMSSLDEDAVLSKRTGHIFTPGLLKKNADGSFSLYEATDYLWRTKGENNTQDELQWKDKYFVRKCYRQKAFLEGEKVYFRIKRRDKGKPLAMQVSCVWQRGMTTGYIIKGEDGPEMTEPGKPVNISKAKGEKHCCHIFVPKAQPKYRKLSSESIRHLDLVLTEYKNNEKHPYHEYTAQWKKFRGSEVKVGEENYFPVYYSNPVGDSSAPRPREMAKRAVEDFLMLSPACITREIYSNRLKKLVNGFQPCSDKRHLCPACALFGTIGSEFAVSSRLRFSDLICEEKPENCYERIVTLPPLSSPKLNNMEFYLKKPAQDAWFWTYDYYVNAAGQVIPCMPQINGRKFYWHQMQSELPQNVARTKLNMTIRPVRKGVLFQGKLYFEKLTHRELEELVWLLNTGEENLLEEKKHGYKLGAAKPLGFGSIAIGVTGVFLRRIVADKENRTVCRKEIPWESSGNAEEYFDRTVVRNFQKMTAFDAVAGRFVSYPIVNGQTQNAADTDNGYEWFTANHKAYDRGKKAFLGMANNRTQMLFAEHMEAMNPELKTTTRLETAIRGGTSSKGNQQKGTQKKKGGNKQNNRDQSANYREWKEKEKQESSGMNSMADALKGIKL